MQECGIKQKGYPMSNYRFDTLDSLIEKHIFE